MNLGGVGRIMRAVNKAQRMKDWGTKEERHTQTHRNKGIGAAMQETPGTNTQEKMARQW